MSGAFVDYTTNTMYALSDIGGYTLVKYSLTGANAGEPAIMYGGDNSLPAMYGLAKGPNGTAYGLTSDNTSTTLYTIDLATGAPTGNRSVTGVPASSTWNGFTWNPVTNKYYMMSRSSGEMFELNVSTGAATSVGTPTGLTGSYGLQVDSSGTFWNLTASSPFSLKTFTLSGSTLSSPTLQGSFSSFQTAAIAILAPPPPWTITLQHGSGATGQNVDLIVPQGSSVALPLGTTCTSGNPCFDPGTGGRQRDWQVMSGTLTVGGTPTTFPASTATVTPTSNVTLNARWIGTLEFSTTSFSSGGTAQTTVSFPTTALNDTQLLTIYAHNASSTLAIDSFSNWAALGSGISSTVGGSCSTSGIPAGGQCTFIVSWTPTGTGSMSSGLLRVQDYGYNDDVTLAGTATTLKTVTFSPNAGTGSLTSQTGVTQAALTRNCVNSTCAINRAGYSFNGWNSQQLGGGTAFADGATYDFLNSVTLYAQWTANSHVVTFDTDGGSSVANGSFNTDGSMNLPAAPTRSGYTFLGWFTASSGGTALSSPYSPSGTSNITLYAQWSANSSGNLPNTGTYSERLLGMSGGLFGLGVALTVTALYRRRLHREKAQIK